MSNDNSTESNPSYEEIPAKWQDLSLEDLQKRDYDIIPPDEVRDDERDRVSKATRGPPQYGEPGWTMNDDSIAASGGHRAGAPPSEGASPVDGVSGDEYESGYYTEAATRIGDESETTHESKRLRELNEGRHRATGHHSKAEAERDKLRIPQALGSSLPLTQREREKVEALVPYLDFEAFGQQGSIVKATLGVVAVLVDERLRDPDDIEDTVQWSEEFKNACKSNHVSMSDFGTVKEKVRDQLSEGVIASAGDGTTKRDPHLPEPTAVREEEPAGDAWEEYDAVYWENVAQRWEQVDDDYKQVLPEEYRELVDRLRRWEPWEERTDDAEESFDDVEIGTFVDILDDTELE